MESSGDRCKGSQDGKSRRKKKQRKRWKGREKKQKKGKTMEVKRVAEEWKIWDKEEVVARLEEEVKKLVPKEFHRWIKVFSKKQSERISTNKPSNTSNSLIKMAINDFWNNIVKNLSDEKHFIVLFRIVYSNNIYNILGFNLGVCDFMLLDSI